MDKHDEEFENFLRKFQLRTPRELLIPPNVPRTRWRFAAVGMVAAAMAVAALGLYALTGAFRAPHSAVVPESDPVQETPAPLVGESAVQNAPEIPETVDSPAPPTQSSTEQVPTVLPQRDPGFPDRIVARRGPQDPDPALTIYLTGPEFESEKLFFEVCGACHIPGLIENYHWDDLDDYRRLVNRKIGMGAAIKPEQAPQLAQYLFTKFGRPPEPGRAIFETACGSCHALDVMNGHVYSERGSYRTIVTNMMNYGAAVSNEQIDSLVEYLFKTYGKGF